MKVSIARRFFFGIALLQAMSAAFILGWYYYSVQPSFAEQASQNVQQTLLHSVESTEKYFQPAERVVQSAQKLISTNVLSLERPDQLSRYFHEMIGQWPQFAGIYVGFPNGSFVYVKRSDQEVRGSSRTKIINQKQGARQVRLVWHGPDYSEIKTETDTSDTYDPRTRPWYRAAIESGEVIWTKPYVFFSSQRPGITSALASTKETGELSFVVGVDIDLSEVSTLLRQVAYGQGTSAFIVTNEGDVIVHSDDNMVMPIADTDDNSLRFRKVEELDGAGGVSGKRGLYKLTVSSVESPARSWKEKFGGKNFVVVTKQISNSNWPWLISAIVPTKNLEEATGEINLILTGVVFLITALACALGYAYSQWTGKPIDKLLFNIKMARQGNVELMEDIEASNDDMKKAADTLRELAEMRRRNG